MTTLAAPKLTGRKWVECFALYALLQGIPLYSGTALMMKLINESEFVGEPFGVAIFMAMASTFHALVNPSLGPKFPHFFRHSFEPLFADPALSVSENISRWLAQPKTAVMLLTSALLLSVLAGGVLSIQ